jgi:hypothetical protein
MATPIASPSTFLISRGEFDAWLTSRMEIARHRELADRQVRYWHFSEVATLTSDVRCWGNIGSRFSGQ